MAGTENYGIKNSKKDLFTGSTSIICSMKCKALAIDFFVKIMNAFVERKQENSLYICTVLWTKYS